MQKTNLSIESLANATAGGYPVVNELIQAVEDKGKPHD